MTRLAPVLTKLALAALAVVVLTGLLGAYATPVMTLALDTLAYCF